MSSPGNPRKPEGNKGGNSAENNKSKSKEGNKPSTASTPAPPAPPATPSSTKSTKPTPTSPGRLGKILEVLHPHLKRANNQLLETTGGQLLQAAATAAGNKWDELKEWGNRSCDEKSVPCGGYGMGPGASFMCIEKTGTERKNKNATMENIKPKADTTNTTNAKTDIDGKVKTDTKPETEMDKKEGGGK